MNRHHFDEQAILVFFFFLFNCQFFKNSQKITFVCCYFYCKNGNLCGFKPTISIDNFLNRSGWLSFILIENFTRHFRAPFRSQVHKESPKRKSTNQLTFFVLSQVGPANYNTTRFDSSVWFYFSTIRTEFYYKCKRIESY